jgi:hypothetical protein
MYAVMLSFIALMAATFYTVRLTFQNFEPVLDKNYYEIGLNYEQAIKDQKILIAEGYNLELKVGDGAAILSTGTQPVVVQVLKTGKISEATSVSLILERSATIKNTYSYVLDRDLSGRFIGKINIPAQGIWNTRTIAEISGKKFEKQGLISVR